jgi:hypothetical protein
MRQLFLALYELAETLHARGALDRLRGLAGAQVEIIDRIAPGLDSPQVVDFLDSFGRHLKPDGHNGR